MAKRSRRTGTSELEEAPINLTPLIDVVFVMLIMFIVVAPMLEMDQVSLAQGKGKNAEVKNVQQNSPITIHVHADNTIWIDQHSITPEQLSEWFMEAKKRYPDIIPQLFHDRRAHFGTYQMIKNAAESAGFEQLQVILEPL